MFPLILVVSDKEITQKVLQSFALTAVTFSVQSISLPSDRFIAPVASPLVMSISPLPPFRLMFISYRKKPAVPPLDPPVAVVPTVNK